MEDFEKYFTYFRKVFWKILTFKSFAKFQITNGNISGCFEKYYQHFWVLFWKLKKKSDGFENYYREFRKVIGIRKYRGNLYIFQNSEEIDVYLKIRRKFTETVRKLLKQVILRKFFLCFENIFWNNCVKFQVDVMKITIVGNIQF